MKQHRCILGTAFLLTLFSVVACFADVALGDDAPAAPRTGALTMKFTMPSKLTDRKEVAERFGMTGTSDKSDYVLANESFWVYVPPNYNHARPAGIVVYTEGASCHPRPLIEAKTACMDDNVIFVMSLDTNQWGYKTAMFVDAIENLEKIYVIDPKRIYTFGDGMDAERLAMGYPDVFTGGSYQDIQIWRLIPLPWLPHGEGMHDVVDSCPPAQWRNKAMNHPLLLNWYQQPGITDATSMANIDATVRKVVAEERPHWDERYNSKAPRTKHGFSALSLGDRGRLTAYFKMKALIQDHFTDIRVFIRTPQMPVGDVILAEIDALDDSPPNPKHLPQFEPTTQP